MKKGLCLLLLTALILTTACAPAPEPAPPQEPEATGPDTEVTQPPAQVEMPDIDLLAPGAIPVLGYGPGGEVPTPISDLYFTPEELQAIRDGNFRAVIVHHWLEDLHNQRKSQGLQDKLEELGIEVVAVTDAGFSVETMISNIETVMAMDPDVMIAMPLDPDATAGAFRRVADAGVPIVFMENVATGMVGGTDFVALVNPDSYGNGKAAAHIMAQELGGVGRVGMVFFDINFFVTNERDRAFRETIAQYYPGIEIVAEFGFADPERAGDAADALFARYPDIDAVYTSWDLIAMFTVASAISAGLTYDDVFITTIDLSPDSASMIAARGFIRGTGAPRSYDTGVAEAMAAAYALIGKPLPSTYIATPTFPTMSVNVLEAFYETLRIDPPQSLIDVWNQHN